MFWIALSIFITGIIITQALEKHNKKIEEFKKQELEANPEFRKKAAYDFRLSNQEYWYEKYKKEYEELQKAWQVADKNGDKDKVNQLNKTLNRAHKQFKQSEQKIEKLKDQIAFGLPKHIFKYNFVIEKITFTETDLQQFRVWAFDNEVERTKRLKSIVNLKGLPISILQETPNEDPYYGAYLANMQAEDKASEIIANLIDTKYLKTNYSNYPFTSPSVEDESDPDSPIRQIYGGGVNGLQGNIVLCKLVSVEQVSI